jgi:hypothetical protein
LHVLQTHHPDWCLFAVISPGSAGVIHLTVGIPENPKPKTERSRNRPNFMPEISIAK